MYPEKLEYEPEYKWFGDDHIASEKYVKCYLHKDYHLFQKYKLLYTYSHNLILIILKI